MSSRVRSMLVREVIVAEKRSQFVDFLNIRMILIPVFLGATVKVASPKLLVGLSSHSFQ
ncbi:MAG: hypothetical protein AAGC74_07070 [Verrucomicrobiota bacterium]